MKCTWYCVWPIIDTHLANKPTTSMDGGWEVVIQVLFTNKTLFLMYTFFYSLVNENSIQMFLLHVCYGYNFDKSKSTQHAT